MVAGVERLGREGNNTDELCRERWQTPRKRACSTLVGFSHECAVDLQRRRTAAAAVTEPTGNGPHVDSSRDQLGGGVMPELVHVHIPSSREHMRS